MEIPAQSGTGAAAPNVRSAGGGPARARIVLAMLLLVYVFNFLDRMILSILAAPIQADLGLSDSEMGLLGGIAFAALYSTLAVPLSVVADRTNRSWVIAVSLVCWSAFTAICGLAQNFWQIFLARLGVGVGEAGGVAPSYALIGDYFPPNQRATALAIYSLGIPIGSAFGLLAGGYIAEAVNWRAAFVFIGVLGVLVAPVFKYFVSDLPRPAMPGSSASPDLTPEPAPEPAPAPTPALAQVLRVLMTKPSFWLLAFGAAVGSMLGYGISFWMPSFVQRSLGLDLFDAALFLAAIMLVGGTSGMLLGGRLGDRLGAANKGWYGWLTAIAYLACGPLMAAGVMTDTLWLAFIFFVIPQGLSYVWFGPVITAMQHLVEPAARAMAAAIFLLIVNRVGLGGGIYALGAFSDALAGMYGQESLRMSIAWSVTLYPLAALLMALAGFRLNRDWLDE